MGVVQWPGCTGLTATQRDSAAHFRGLAPRMFSLCDVLQRHVSHHHRYIMENIICSLTYFALQRNVYLKFLGVLLKGL